MIRGGKRDYPTAEKPSAKKALYQGTTSVVSPSAFGPLKWMKTRTLGAPGLDSETWESTNPSSPALPWFSTMPIKPIHCIGLHRLRKNSPGAVGRGFIPGTKSIKSPWASQAAENLTRAVGRGFIPGTKSIKSPWASQAAEKLTRCGRPGIYPRHKVNQITVGFTGCGKTHPVR
jgi:hypothetical protein